MNLNLHEWEEPEVYQAAIEFIKLLSANVTRKRAEETARVEADKAFAQFVEAHPEVLPAPPEQEADQAEQEAAQDEQEPAPNPPVHLVTYAQVRAESVKLVKKDRKIMNEILAEFGAGKLGEIAEDDYPKLYERLVSANAG